MHRLSGRLTGGRLRQDSQRFSAKQINGLVLLQAEKTRAKASTRPLVKASVVDPHHFDADPDADSDSTYNRDANLDADQDTDFYLMRIRIQILASK